MCGNLRYVAELTLNVGSARVMQKARGERYCTVYVGDAKLVELSFTAGEHKGCAGK